jgi:hypothetical protein
MVSRRSDRRVAASALTLAALVLARPADAEDPVLLSIYAPMGLYYEAQLVDEIVYMAGADFFHVVDVSDPTQPTELAVRDVSFAVGLEVVGDRAYLSQYTEPTLQVLSIANPAMPVPLGGWSLPVVGYGHSLDVVGDLVYLLADPGGLRILDVSALPTIVEVGTFDPPAFLRSVAVSGDYAYVAAGSAGLFIVDLSDPTKPAHVDTLTGYAGSVEIEGTHLYFGGAGGFRIFDVSNARSPVLVGESPILTGRLRVDESEGLAYAGESVIDISDVTQPFLVATISIPYPFGEIINSDGSNGVVFVPHVILGLHVFRTLVPEPSAAALQVTALITILTVAVRTRSRRGRSDGSREEWSRRSDSNG